MACSASASLNGGGASENIAIGAASGAVVAALGSDGDAITRRVYDDFVKFRRKALSWSHLGEQSFWNARTLPFKY